MDAPSCEGFCGPEMFVAAAVVIVEMKFYQAVREDLEGFGEGVF